MKIVNRITLTLLIIVGCMFSFAICSFAEASTTTGKIGVVVSNTIGKPKVDIESILNDKVTEELVAERYSMFSIEKPDQYTFDTSVYLIEYTVSTDYWNNVSTMNYKGLTEVIDYSYPTIYIPLFGDIANMEGDILNRVIGHIKLSYDWTNCDYRLGMSLYNLTDSDYRDKKNVWFYEEIADYIDQSKFIVQQAFLIRYPSSLSDGHEKIAVIQTKDNAVILDVSNSLNINMETREYSAYTVSEYRTLRMEIEKNLYKMATRWDDNPVGGNVDLSQGEEHNPVGEWSLGVIIISIFVGVVAFLLFKKHHKRLSK